MSVYPKLELITSLDTKSTVYETERHGTVVCYTLNKAPYLYNYLFCLSQEMDQLKRTQAEPDGL